jgi:CDP-glucose 4,6-dehydratase
VESVVINPAFWVGRRVLLTGHTGFKGAWATLVLKRLGAEIYGFALTPESEAGLFVAAELEHDVNHAVGDVRDLGAVCRVIREARPSVILHMAAQSLVRRSYTEPVETYATNVMGTVHLLEAVRRTSGVDAVVVVSSDKCYENVGWMWGYREIDPLGGHDPYSNSKACAEIAVEAYRRSFFSGETSTRVASGRAGNVIGGGDWARDRLVPDAMRAFMAGEPLKIRNPGSTRPWQHVLDPILAYVLLIEHLVDSSGKDFAQSWNFGPSSSDNAAVSFVADSLVRLWGGAARWVQDEGEHPHEAASLKLDCTKAIARLKWRPMIGLKHALALTVDWYRTFERGNNMRDFTIGQIEQILFEVAHHRSLDK